MLNLIWIIKTLKKHCFKEGQHLAIASKASAKTMALIAFKEYGWNNNFSSIQIYYDTKTTHMNEIRKDLKLENCNDFLFFDDDQRNIIETSKIGVHAYLVTQDEGLNRFELFDGLNKFNKSKSKINLDVD
jgi:hypothetical protein